MNYLWVLKLIFFLFLNSLFIPDRRAIYSWDDLYSFSLLGDFSLSCLIFYRLTSYLHVRTILKMINQLINKCPELNECVNTRFAARVSPRHSRVDLAPEAIGEVKNE